MRKRRRKTSLIALRESNEINITSLMDIVVLLLFVFIITMPIIEQNLPVTLPKAGKAGAMDLSKKHHTIEISLKNGLTLDGAAISVQRLEEKMTEISAKEPETPVYVQADEKIDYGQVVEVIEVLKKSNVKTMGLVTQAK